MEKQKTIIDEEIIITNVDKKIKKSAKPNIFNAWRLLFFKGIFAIIFGVIALALPELAIIALLFYLGVVLVLVWLFMSVWWIIHIKQNKHRYMWLIEWLLDICVWLTIIFYPDVTIQFLIILISAWALAKSILYIINAIRIKRHIALYLINSVILILFAVILFLNPIVWIIAITYILWFFAIVFGIWISYLSLKLRKLTD